MVSVNPENSPFPGGFDLRHRLKLTQEGLDEDLWYVTHLSISPKQDVFAAGGPQGSIKLFNMDTLLYVADFKAHSARITGLEYCHTNEHCFWSTSIDTALSYWDSRKAFKSPIYRILSPNNCSFSSCGLNCNDEIIAASTEPYGEDVCLYLWDVRKLSAEKLLQSHMEMYTDSHNSEITQIQFSPVQSHQMASGSTDGLICLFDVSKGSEDDALDSVLNTGSSVSQIGYFGPKSTDLYCLTHIETLQLWDTVEGKMTTEFTNPREENGSKDNLDYFIDCLYHPVKDELYYVGGTNSFWRITLNRLYLVVINWDQNVDQNGDLYILQVRAVQSVDNAVHQINDFPVESVVGVVNTYRLNSDLFGGQRYPSLNNLAQFSNVELNSGNSILMVLDRSSTVLLFSASGRLHLCHVKDSELETVCPLMGGHTATVRCLQWDHKSETLLTGGEDSIISCWKSAKPQTSHAGKAVSGAVDKLKVHGSKPYEKPSNDRKET